MQLLLPWLLVLLLCSCLLTFLRGPFQRTHSYFLRLVIPAGNPQDDQTSLPRAHSIRDVATSAAFLHNWSVSKVLEAATWRSNPVFASFYLQDVYFSSDDLHSLRPFFAAGFVVQ